MIDGHNFIVVFTLRKCVQLLHLSKIDRGISQPPNDLHAATKRLSMRDAGRLGIG